MGGCNEGHWWPLITVSSLPCCNSPVMMGRVLGLFPKVPYHSASSAIKPYSPSAKKREGIDEASLCQALNEDLDGS